jgi:hypothetical protein
MKIEANGRIIEIINGTPHNLKFEDGSILEGNLELAKLLTAIPIERKIDDFRVKTIFQSNPKATEYLNNLPYDTFIITSIIGLELNNPRLISPIATPETNRLPPEQRICFKNKFNCKVI